MSQSFIGSRELGRSDSDQNLRSVRIQIDLAAIRANLTTARKCSRGSLQFATIKADAYGHGAVVVAHALSPRVSKRQYSEPDLATREPSEGFADGFAVVTIDEALELRQSGIRQPILVLQGPQSMDACAELKRNELWPVIHDLQQYAWYRQCPERNLLQAWLKVDTGMGRLGVQPSEAQDILSRDDGIAWHGMLSHFACSDEVDNPFTATQIKIFNKVASERKLQRSLANSSAVLAWPTAISDWARPGIMLYGCNPLDRALPDEVSLVPAMTVTAPLISVKNLPSGAGVGYAQTYLCPEDMPVGYVALGYRDGIPRMLDDTAAVMIDGVTCPIIGRVSMDSMAVDLRGIPTAQLGDPVELWGKGASIDALASAAGTINYELLTSIRGQREYLM
ncbi:MAG: alanine racemase [Granulosicoccus sp.]